MDSWEVETNRPQLLCRLSPTVRRASLNVCVWIVDAIGLRDIGVGRVPSHDDMVMRDADDFSRIPCTVAITCAAGIT